MRKIILLLFTIFIFTGLSAQTDRNGNPVFNSELISEEKLENFELTSSYYNIRENIANKKSSVYVSEAPTLNDYLKFSRNLPAVAFIAHKGADVICMIMLMQKNEDGKTSLFYNVINPKASKSVQIPCGVWGEINEKRADELLSLKVDTAARVIDLPNDGKGLLFDGIAYRIQAYTKLKAEVIALINQLMGAANRK